MLFFEIWFDLTCDALRIRRRLLYRNGNSYEHRLSCKQLIGWSSIYPSNTQPNWICCYWDIFKCLTRQRPDYCPATPIWPDHCCPETALSAAGCGFSPSTHYSSPQGLLQGYVFGSIQSINFEIVTNRAVTLPWATSRTPVAIVDNMPDILRYRNTSATASTIGQFT